MIQRVVLVFLFTSCAANSAQVANIVIATGTAVAAAAINRSQGGCIAACPVGTTCNAATGFCDTLPCRGMCGVNEVCAVRPDGERCMVKGFAPPLATSEDGAAPASKPTDSLW